MYVGHSSNQFSGDVTGNVVQAGHIEHLTVAARTRLAMSGLPAEPGSLVGRDRKIAEVIALLGSSQSIVLSGLAGVGKTALALRVGHEAIRAGRFPGGVLFADLRGYDREPARPTDVLAAFVRALGLSDGQVPVEQGELEVVYRSMLADRAADEGPVLLFLDNASSSTQIRPLLPGAGSHTVLVTSRHWHSDLDGARPVSVGVLDAESSVLLLASGDPSGKRLDHEPEAAREVAALCGHLPLALRIVAALLSDDPAQPVSRLAGALHDGKGRLAELQYGDDLAVGAAFGLSYARLSEAERRMFRLLALAPGHLVSLLTAQALAGTEMAETKRLLARLCRAHMLQQVEQTSDWYRFHDLVRLYAGLKLGEEGSPEQVTDAVDRMLAAYVNTACAAVNCWENRTSAESAQLSEPASAWLAMERQALITVAAVAHHSGQHELMRMLAVPMSQYLEETKRWADAGYILTMAVQSALQHGDAEIEARTRFSLASALWFLGERREGVLHLTEALRIARDLGNRPFEGEVLQLLGAVYQGLGETGKSAECRNAALKIAAETGDIQQQAALHCSIGAGLDKSGDLEGAVACYKHALDLSHQASSPAGIATVKRLMAGMYLDSLDSLDLAYEQYQEAFDIYRDVEDYHNAADVWYQLGLVCLRAGELELAEQEWQGAILLARHLEYEDLIQRLEVMFTRYGMNSNGDDPLPAPHKGD
jgi:tetratricopeptide (TPR) repeat protein